MHHTTEHQGTTTFGQDVNQRDSSFSPGNGQNQSSLGEVADQAKQVFTSTVDDVKEQATSKLAEQKQQAANRLQGVASALRTTGQDLSAEDETLAQYVEGFADQIEKVSGYIQNREFGELWQDAQRLARRQPELFVAGALAMGFLAGRFFKSSATPPDSRYHARAGWQGSYNQGRYSQGQYGQELAGQYGSSPESQSAYIDAARSQASGSEYPYGDLGTSGQNWQGEVPSTTQAVASMESEGNYARQQ